MLKVLLRVTDPPTVITQFCSSTPALQGFNYFFRSLFWFWSPELSLTPLPAATAAAAAGSWFK